jgi:hypothetical protein
MIYKKWEEADDEFLRNNYMNFSRKEIAAKLNRTVESVKSRARTLNLTVNNIKDFTDDEFLNAIKSSNTHKEAAKKLGYKITNCCVSSKYTSFLNRLKPDISHFSLFSRSKCNKSGDSVESLYNKYRNESVKRSKDFYLSMSEIKQLVFQKCFYCGGGLNSIHGKLLHTGIDRMDNNIGYTKENCVPCCKFCNKMKHILSKDKFLEHIKKVYEHQQQKQQSQQAS